MAVDLHRSGEEIKVINVLSFS